MNLAEDSNTDYKKTSCWVGRGGPRYLVISATGYIIAAFAELESAEVFAGEDYEIVATKERYA